MANLNFKWGLHTNLPTSLTEAQIGSLFFTKDEGSLYLGVETGKKPQRIQGVVQYYEDLTQFKSNVLPPYSEDVIYYIASESALVKWSGKKVAADGTKTSGEFTVLNVTASEFTDAVNNLNTSIAGNATNIGVNASNITGLRTDLGTNDKADTTAFLRIKALEEAVDALEALTGTGGAGNSLTDRIKALEDWKAETATTVSGLVTDVASHNTTIESHTIKITNLETWKGTINTKLETVEGDISDLKDADSSFETRIKANEDNISTHTTEIGDLQTSLAAANAQVETNKNNITNLQNNLNTANGKINTLEDWKTSASNTIANQGQRLSTAEGKITTNEGNISTNAGDIAGLKNTTSGLRTDLGTNDKAGTAAFTRIASLESASADANTAITGLGTRLTAAEKTIGEHTTKLGEINNSISGINTSIAGINTEVAKKADSSTVSALSERVDDHKDRLDGIDGEIDGIDGKIANIEAAIGPQGDIQKNIAQNATDIAGAKDRIGVNENAIKNINGTLTDHKGRIAKIESDIVEIGNVNKTQGEAITNLQTRVGTAEGNITQLQKDVAKNVQDIGNVAKDLADNYYTKTEADNKHTNLETTLRGELTSHINAANALVYVGGINTASEWNTIKAKDASIGHTYVVAASGLNLNINGSEIICYAGDLLIATGTETNNVIPAANIEWVHVKAGYNESLASTMRIIDGDGATHKKATVQLSSYSGAAGNNHGDLGEFSIISDSDNLEVKVNGGDITVSMVWGSF